MTVELLEAGVFEQRRRCECCGLPTLAIYNEGEPDFAWDLTPTSCDLCEWDSHPLDVNGNISPSSASDEERNDGLSLETARANFARFSSIYDPDDLPGWKLSPPTDNIVSLRSKLRSAYTGLLAHGSDPGFEQWGQVHECERALSAALTAQRELDLDEAERETAGDVSGDLTEWDASPPRSPGAPAGAPATYVRLYADEAGESRFEKLALFLSPTQFAPPAPPLLTAQFLPTTQSFLVGTPSGWNGEDPHPSPRRQIFCVLQGDFRITASNGDVRYFSCGDLLLLEDTWGKGHSTRITSEEDVLIFAVALAGEEVG
jgi:hypothetical protein